MRPLHQYWLRIRILQEKLESKAGKSSEGGIKLRCFELKIELRELSDEMKMKQ
jgi:hypothetical protein